MGQISDLSTPSDYCIIPAPLACRVTNVSVAARSNFTTAPNVVSAEIVSAGVGIGGGTATNLNISMAAGSGVNAVFSGSVSSGNSMTTSQALLVKTDGGGTGASIGDVIVTFDVS